MANEHRGVCPGCGELVYPDVCQCGNRMEDHGEDSGHTPVPFGCKCHQKKETDSSEPTCPKCGSPIITEADHDDPNMVGLCLCSVPIEDMFVTVETDLVRLGVSSHRIWVARTRDVLWLVDAADTETVATGN